MFGFQIVSLPKTQTFCHGFPLQLFKRVQPHSGKLPAVTHIPIFTSARKMKSQLRCVAGPVSEKKTFDYCSSDIFCIQSHMREN